MLERILAELEKHDAQLSPALLSHLLQIEQPVLEGMLQTLERKGRIVDVGADAIQAPYQCRSCPIQRACTSEGKWYQLAKGIIVPTHKQ